MSSIYEAKDSIHHTRGHIIYLHKHFPQRHSGPGKENYSTVLVVWSGFWADMCFCICFCICFYIYFLHLL